MKHCARGKRAGIALFVLLTCCTITGHAQSGNYFANWNNRVRKTMGYQPDWVVPLVTSPSGVYQLLRVDILRQISSANVTSWNYGGSKGLILIPWYKTELDLFAPSYIQYLPRGHNGFGDTTFQLKYRPFSRNNHEGNYAMNFALAGTIPTGSYTNGNAGATISPTAAAGKGYGKFNVQSSFAAAIPVSNTSKVGRTLQWNTVLQYHPGSIFWPELEDNSAFYRGGPRAGKMQNFLLPGMMLNSFKLVHYESKQRLALLFGAGMQIATSHYHGYNHGLVIAARMNF